MKQGTSETTVEEQRNEELLFVVSCTKKKIWQENSEVPEFVSAREAYKGPDFLQWIDDPLSKKTRWVILSAKYGFLEPDHPISNYDITFNDPKTCSVSDQTLINQVKYQCRWKDRQALNSFRQVVVRGSLTYLEKAKIAFSPTQASVISWHDYRLGLGQADMQASRLREHLVLLLKVPILNFRSLRREDLPASPGIYVIYEIDSLDPPLYVGKSENLARRIWDNHIKGNVEASIYRKKIGQIQKTGDEKAITEYIINSCQFRFLIVSEPLLSRLEHFAIAVLQPRLNE